MAGKKIDDKAALLAELAAARARLTETGQALRRKLDVTTRTKESFSRHRPAWLGGAALLGLVLSKIPARKRTVFVEQATGRALGAAGKLGLAWSAAKIVIDLARPFVAEFAGKHIGEVARRFGQTSRQPGEDTRPNSP